MFTKLLKSQFISSSSSCLFLSLLDISLLKLLDWAAHGRCLCCGLGGELQWLRVGAKKSLAEWGHPCRGVWSYMGSHSPRELARAQHWWLIWMRQGGVSPEGRVWPGASGGQSTRFHHLNGLEGIYVCEGRVVVRWEIGYIHEAWTKNTYI